MKWVLVTVSVAALAAFLGHRLLKLSERVLATREVPVKNLPNCHLLKNIECGAEDFSILRDGLAIISTGLKYPGMPSCAEPGKIYTLDLLDPRLTPVELAINGELDQNSFNPHGISVYTDETDNTIHLFVVNHPQPHTSQVEIFRFVEDDNTIVHRRTVKHDLLHSVNDIVAVGEESFYATNDHSYPSEVLHWLTVFLGLPWARVVYYSPEAVKEVGDGFMSANGVNMSPDKRYLYVSDILDHKIAVFEIKKYQELVYVKSVAVGSLCDNIEVDHVTGDLWLGCHPNGAKVAENDPKEPAGSEVLRIQDIHSESPVVTQVYADDGSVLIGSSVAAPYGGKLLIGTIYQKALICDLK
ncbi:serum paraoxonase/arylesterase 2-like [Esox lucius]|uniref:Paraoxonase n=1 Tax=Esox lucius TaxID=8010 RepID=A0AAY5KMF6_ESOLU|nr:serum paraoxonase/arylesterase 2-like [Esox lucius]